MNLTYKQNTYLNYNQNSTVYLIIWCTYIGHSPLLVAIKFLLIFGHTISLCYCSKNVITLQVGNKCDKEGERMVTREEGQKCARKYQMMFIEVSAVAGE